MLRCCRSVAVFSVLLSASVAFAQRPQGQGGRPGAFGAGFGGGFGGFGGITPLSLANNEAVQKELNISDEQAGQLKSLNDDVREEMRGAFAGVDFQGLRDLSQEEREKKMAEFREKSAAAQKKINDKVKPKLAEILNASQSERLQQIAWQAAGPQAYQDADLIAALKITKEQQDKLAAITKEYTDKQRELFPRGGAGGGERPNFEEIQKKMRELGESRDKALSDVLTTEQREQFAKLKGKPFDVAQLRRGFGGPGGGFGGGRPGAAPGGGENSPGRPQRRPGGGDKKAN